MLAVVKRRAKHTCSTSWIVVAVVAWEGVPLPIADDLYSVLVYKLNRYGNPTERRCGVNDERTCVCQGFSQETCGASYSFGCSWSMYYNMCKYARSKTARKFRLTDEQEESDIEHKLQSLATILAPLYKRMAPSSYTNQTALEDESLECRLGYEHGRPWAGVTACADFCAHAHKDNHNMNNGCTVVATLTKHRGFAKPDDEQLHVLPLYVLDPTDEYGTYEGYQRKIQSGALEVLNKYPCEIRLRTVPLLSCRARNLLARGLPIPKRGRGRGKAKGRDIGRRPQVNGINKAPVPPVELNDLFGLNMDSVLSSIDFSDPDDVLNHYGLNGSDYGWLLDVGPDNDLGLSCDIDSIISSKDDSTSSDDVASSSNSVADNCYNDSQKNVGNLAASESHLSQRESAPVQTSASNESQLTPSVPPTSQLGSSLKTVSGPGASPTVQGFPHVPALMPPPQSPAPKRPFSPQSCSSPMSSRSTTPILPLQSGSPTVSPLPSPVVRSAPQQMSPCHSPLGSPSLRLNPPPSTSPCSSPLPSPFANSFTPPGPAQDTSPSSSPLPGASNSTPSIPAQSPQGCQPPLASPFGGPAGTLQSSPFGPSCSVSMPLTPVSSPVQSNQGTASSQHSQSVSQYQMCTNSMESQSQNFCKSQNDKLQSHLPNSSQINPSVTCSLQQTMQNGFNPSPQMHYRSTNQFSRGPNMQEEMPFHQDRLQSDPFSNLMSYTNNNSNEIPCSQPKEPETVIRYSDNIENFHDPDIGGVAIALTHGSVLFECAKHELHATTALKNPNRRDPKRISLVFYQHKNLIYRNHGWERFEEKMEKKRSEEERLIKEGKLEPSPRKKKKMMKEGFVFPEEKMMNIEPEFQRMNGLASMKLEAGINPVLSDGHGIGNRLGHPQGHQVDKKPAIVDPHADLKNFKHPDLKSPPVSYGNYPRPLHPSLDTPRPYSPCKKYIVSPQRPAYSLASSPPNVMLSMAPSLNPRHQKPRPTPDHTYSIGHPHGGFYGDHCRPPFNPAMQEFTPYNSMPHPAAQSHQLPGHHQQRNFPSQYPHHHGLMPGSYGSANHPSNQVHHSQNNMMHSPYGTPMHSPQNMVSPRGAPVLSPHDNSMHSPCSNPHQSPHSNSLQSPHSHLHHSPQGNPLHSPLSNSLQCSYGNSVHSSHANVMQSPHGSLMNSPHSNPMQSPHGTPIHSPHANSMLSPHGNILSPQNNYMLSPPGNPPNTSLPSPQANMQSPLGPACMLSPNVSTHSTSALSPRANPHNMCMQSQHSNPLVSMANMQSPSMAGPLVNTQSTCFSPQQGHQPTPTSNTFTNVQNTSMSNQQSTQLVNNMLSPNSNSTCTSLPNANVSPQSSCMLNTKSTMVTKQNNCLVNSQMTQNASVQKPVASTHNTSNINVGHPSVQSPQASPCDTSLPSPAVDQSKNIIPSSVKSTSQSDASENCESVTKPTVSNHQPENSSHMTQPSKGSITLQNACMPGANFSTQNVPSSDVSSNLHSMAMPGHHINTNVPDSNVPVNHHNMPVLGQNQGYPNPQIPQPSYGLTPPYSPGPHGALAQGTPLPSFNNGPSNYTALAPRGPPTHSTSTWSEMRYAPPFRVTGPYSEWSGN
ncbi:uncharacterized protein LOC135206249 isoform X2 [Macrobrachium nipponense]